MEITVNTKTVAGATSFISVSVTETELSMMLDMVQSFNVKPQTQETEEDEYTGELAPYYLGYDTAINDEMEDCPFPDYTLASDLWHLGFGNALDDMMQEEEFGVEEDLNEYQGRTVLHDEDYVASFNYF